MNDSNTSNGFANQAAPAADISAYQPPASITPPVSNSSMAASTQPVVTNQAMNSGELASQTNNSSADSMPDSESLEAQNIFELLGVGNGSDSEKEAFLDELQQVIWQDFVESDLQLLLTKEELGQVRTLQAKTQDVSKQQEEIVGFLENLIPDLEDIMLEKALELKREMVHERIVGLKEYLAGQSDKLAAIQTAEDLIKQNKWASATSALNKL